MTPPELYDGSSSVSYYTDNGEVRAEVYDCNGNLLHTYGYADEYAEESEFDDRQPIIGRVKDVINQGNHDYYHDEGFYFSSDDGQSYGSHDSTDGSGWASFTEDHNDGTYTYTDVYYECEGAAGYYYVYNYDTSSYNWDQVDYEEWDFGCDGYSNYDDYNYEEWRRRRR